MNAFRVTKAVCITVLTLVAFLALHADRASADEGLPPTTTIEFPRCDHGEDENGDCSDAPQYPEIITIDEPATVDLAPRETLPLPFQCASGQLDSNFQCVPLEEQAAEPQPVGSNQDLTDVQTIITPMYAAQPVVRYPQVQVVHPLYRALSQSTPPIGVFRHS